MTGFFEDELQVLYQKLQDGNFLDKVSPVSRGSDLARPIHTTQYVADIKHNEKHHPSFPNI